MRKRIGEIKELYHKILKLSGHPHAFKILCAISFVEASFFPIPIYPLLFAMCIENPKKALRYGIGTALSSVLGALLGYAIGYMFWNATQDFFFTYLFSRDLFEIVQQKYQENTFWALMLCSLTPVPFKVFTISGGALHVPLLPFFFGALAGRSPRFVIIGLLFHFKGEDVKFWIEKHFTTFMCVISALAIVGFVTYKLLMR